MKKCLIISVAVMLLSICAFGQDVAKVHRVKWYESIESISRKYGISIESLLIFNNLKDKDLKTGQQILIPTCEVERQDNVVPDAVSDFDQGIVKEDEDEYRFIPLFGRAKAAIILPFNAKSEHPSTNYLDFYSGFLTAANALKEQGLRIKLTVIDLGDYTDFSDIFRKYDFRDFDFVVGPASAKDIPEFAEHCRYNKVPLISPMDTKAEYLTDDNQYVIQVPSCKEAQIRNMVRSLRYSGANDNVILLHENSEDTAYCNSVCRELARQDIPFSPIQYGILDGRSIDAVIKSKMTSNGCNHIIVASEKEAIAADMVRNATILTRDTANYRIALYCSPKLRSYESVEAESFHSTNAHISLPYYIDYTSPDVIDFVMKFRALYNCEPTAYAFQGYDIAAYFFTALDKYGKKFIKKIDGFPQSLLQSDMHFEKKPNGGIINNATVNIVYSPGYKVTVER